MCAEKRVDPRTVQVGDRVRFASTSYGTVVQVGPVWSYGTILWDDGHRVESAMTSWRALYAVESDD